MIAPWPRHLPRPVPAAPVMSAQQNRSPGSPPGVLFRIAAPAQGQDLNANAARVVIAIKQSAHRAISRSWSVKPAAVACRLRLWTSPRLPPGCGTILDALGPAPGPEGSQREGCLTGEQAGPYGMHSTEGATFISRTHRMAAAHSQITNLLHLPTSPGPKIGCRPGSRPDSRGGSRLEKSLIRVRLDEADNTFHARTRHLRGHCPWPKPRSGTWAKLLRIALAHT